MKVFTYTKANGETSERRGIVLAEPRDMYLMLDVSHLEDTEAEEVEEAIQEQNRRHLEEKNQLVRELELGDRYRNFKRENMS